MITISPESRAVAKTEKLHTIQLRLNGRNAGCSTLEFACVVEDAALKRVKELVQEILEELSNSQMGASDEVGWG